MTPTTRTISRSHARLAPAVAVLGVAALATLTACGGSSNPLATSSATAGASSAATSPTAGTTPIKIGSADFSESQLLAAIYAGALKAKGVNASATDPIGSRETYLKGLTDGSIQVMPEYTGALALYYKKDMAETAADKVYAALKAALPADLTVLDPSAAEDNDSITVTKATADAKKLTKVSDLAGVAKDMTLAAPPEFQQRAQGVPGLAKTYNVTFGQFRALKGQALIQALKNGQADAANVFTTDPAISANGFVVLQDDKKLFGSQNVVPLLTKSAATAEVAAALNAVSAKLTTAGLRDLLTKVDVNHEDVAKVAQAWLTSNGLG